MKVVMVMGALSMCLYIGVFAQSQRVQSGAINTQPSASSRLSSDFAITQSEQLVALENIHTVLEKGLPDNNFAQRKDAANQLVTTLANANFMANQREVFFITATPLSDEAHRVAKIDASAKHVSPKPSPLPTKEPEKADTASMALNSMLASPAPENLNVSQRTFVTFDAIPDVCQSTTLHATGDIRPMHIDQSCHSRDLAVGDSDNKTPLF